MKRSIKIILLLISVLLSTQESHGLTRLLFDVYGCFDNSLVTPMRNISILYEGYIEENGDGVAKITGNGQEYESESIKIENETILNDYGILTIEFPNILLDLGSTYTITVPSGLVKSLNDGSIDDELTYSFKVAKNLEYYVDQVSGSRDYLCDNILGYAWEFEVEDGAQAIIYREGQQVRSYSYFSWQDMSWSFIHLNFKNDDLSGSEMKLKLEEGINYTLEIPYGSFHCIEREDLVNSAVRIDFTGGGCENKVDGVKYESCSLDKSDVVKSLGVVDFYFGNGILLLDDQEILLYDLTTEEEVKSVLPIVVEEDGKWVLRADFGEEPLQDVNQYEVRLKDSTVLTSDGDFAVNEAVNVSVPTGISGVADVKSRDKVIFTGEELRYITSEIAHLSIYDVSGREVIRKAIQGECVIDLRNLAAGVYFYRTESNGLCSQAEKIVIK